MNTLKKGLIHVYTGRGKGKTTAALGLAIRARGQGLNVIIIRFLKGNKLENKEKDILEKNKIHVKNLNTYGYFEVGSNKESQKKLVDEIQKGWEYVKKIIAGKKYQVIVLDEINVCLSLGIIPINQLIDALSNKPDNKEIICTGRYAPEKLIKNAHYVTEMKYIKHPFKKGIIARAGIEY